MTEATLEQGGGLTAGPRASRRPEPVSAPPALPRPPALPALLAILGLAGATGMGATWIATSAGAGFGQLKVGPWVSYPRSGATDADPYTKAVLARTGEIPLGLGEGLAFRAGRDSGGMPLVGACTYRVVGRVPPTRYWSLTLNALDGSVIPNAAGRSGFTSGEVVRDGKGVLSIVVSREARPGNWLPVESGGRFQLVLRLYDTPVSGTAAALDATLLPSIESEGCP